MYKVRVVRLEWIIISRAHLFPYQLDITLHWTPLVVLARNHLPKIFQHVGRAKLQKTVCFQYRTSLKLNSIVLEYRGYFDSDLVLIPRAFLRAGAHGSCNLSHLEKTVTEVMINLVSKKLMCSQNLCIDCALYDLYETSNLKQAEKYKIILHYIANYW
jgi:hypothetical protein